MFKPYENKSSIFSRNSRIGSGGRIAVSGDKLGWWERRTLPRDDINEITYIITNSTQYRPDIVSFQFYLTTQLEWVILQYNNIVDINEEFVSGRKIVIPSAQFVKTSILSVNFGILN